MNKKIYIGLIGVALILSISGTAIYALTEVSVSNHFSTGIVDIEVNEYRKNSDGTETLWSNVTDILPGEKISKIPRITNYGNDSYIRAKVTFENSPVNDDDIYGMSDRWIYGRDGYYYYADILSTGESVDMFEGIDIPVDLDEKLSDSSFQIGIDVEAVQSQNFVPEFGADHPWGDIEILPCGKEGLYSIGTFKTEDSQTFQLRYEGDADGLVTNADDFFSNFPVMLPGDTYEDTLNLVNNSDNDMKLYFRTEAMEETDLLEKISLRISKCIDGETEMIYEGSLRGDELTAGILLASLEKGASGMMTYQIYVPSELNNAYTIMDDYVVWIFSSEPVLDSKTVSTGDQRMNIGLALMIAGIAFGSMVLIFGNYMKARGKHEK